MLPSSSEPVLIEGAVSKRGKSVAGIGLWWKTRYLRLTSSFLTVTDLKQQTLLASIPTPDFRVCAPVKARRSTGRRFLLRLSDGSVLQLATLTPNECVQWVTVINGVIAVCEKQRAKDTLAWQRRKEAALQAGAGAFALSAPNLTQHEGFHTPQQPTATGPLILHPHPLTPTSLPIAPAPVPSRAQTSVVPSATSGVQGVESVAAHGLVPVEGGLTRSSSTGVVMQRHVVERRKSRDRTMEESRVQAKLGRRGGTSRKGDNAPEEEGRRGRAVNWEEKSGPPRSSSRRRDEFDESHSHLYDDDGRYERRGGGGGGGDRLSPLSEEEAERGRYSSRYDDHYVPYPSMPMVPQGYYPYAYAPPPSAPWQMVQRVEGWKAIGPPPTQRLLFFFLLFLLFSFAILLSGHTFRTSNQVTSLYHQHVTHPNATLHAYAQPLSQALQTWPLMGMTVSGLYLAYLFQVVMREKSGRGGDEVDWLGGAMAGLLCTYCLYAASQRMKLYLHAFGYHV